MFEMLSHFDNKEKRTGEAADNTISFQISFAT